MEKQLNAATHRPNAGGSARQAPQMLEPVTGTAQTLQSSEVQIGQTLPAMAGKIYHPVETRISLYQDPYRDLYLD